MPINLVVMSGNLGNDVDYKSFQNGSVANMNLAVDESYRNRQTGEMVPKVQWFRLVAYKGWADYANKHLRKGSKIQIKGKLNNSSWVDKQTNQKRYSTEIIVEFMERLDWNKDQSQNNNQNNQSGYGQYNNAPQTPQQQPAQAPQAPQAPQPNYNNDNSDPFQGQGEEWPDEPPMDIPFGLGSDPR